MQDHDSPSDSAQLLVRATEAQAASATSPAAPPATPAATLTESASPAVPAPPPSVQPASAPAQAVPPPPSDAAASELTEADYGPIPRTFVEMGLSEDVAGALRDMGFSEPMPVQQRVYRPALAGRDLIVQSRTGSGKTAAFGIPFVQQVLDPDADTRNGYPQVLALGPTRELALQVSNEVSRIAARRKLVITAIYGGAPMGRQVEALKAGAHMVSGTPGRVLDHLRRGTLNLSRVKALVLDEADEMLSMGFLEDITEILRRCPPERQTLLFSATMPDEVLRLQHRYLRAPLNVQLSGEGISAAEIIHAYYMVTGMGRMRDLLRVIEIERPESAIIFCNTREETSAVAEFLRNHGHDAEPISSDLTQADRERVMKRMKQKDLKFLCATDVAARGIDISDLPFVINYTFPESAEVYVHRTGRTGRAGKRGIAISLISPRELGNFYYLKLTYKIRPEERALPTEAELQTLREGQFMDRLQKDLGSKNPGPEFRSLLRRLLASETGESVLAQLLEQHLNQKPARPPHSEPPARPSERRPREKTDRRATGPGTTAPAMTAREMTDPAMTAPR
jgi:ATP-dependent RNA helicase DeaD